PFPVGSLFRRFSLRSTALRLLKVESFPPEAGPCHLFRFSLDQASLRALEGNGILRSTARCARSSLRSVKRKSFCSGGKRGGFAFYWARRTTFLFSPIV